MAIFLAKGFVDFGNCRMSIENGLEDSLDYCSKTRVVRIEENISHEYHRENLILRFVLPHRENLVL
ncbi:MAG: hypothetical protein E7D50_06205 [Finegoldia magna]|nr:hypothetical protein [Finegoldia magna]